MGHFVKISARQYIDLFPEKLNGTFSKNIDGAGIVASFLEIPNGTSCENSNWIV